MQRKAYNNERKQCLKPDQIVRRAIELKADKHTCVNDIISKETLF